MYTIDPICCHFVNNIIIWPNLFIYFLFNCLTDYRNLGISFILCAESVCFFFLLLFHIHSHIWKFMCMFSTLLFSILIRTFIQSIRAWHFHFIQNFVFVLFFCCCCNLKLYILSKINFQINRIFFFCLISHICWPKDGRKRKKKKKTLMQTWNHPVFYVCI